MNFALPRNIRYKFHRFHRHTYFSINISRNITRFLFFFPFFRSFDKKRIEENRILETGEKKIIGFIASARKVVSRRAMKPKFLPALWLD